MEEHPYEGTDEGSSSFKEDIETTSSELTGSQKKALHELKILIQDALEKSQLTSIEGDHATIWGVPLLGDIRSDAMFLRFLKSRNYEVYNAFSMIKNTILWRDEVGIESLLEDDFGNEYKNVMFNHGYDKEGCPVLYMVLEDNLSDNPSQIVSDGVQKHRTFLRWLIQFAELNMRKLDFNVGAKNSFLLVIDLKCLTWYSNRDLYKVIYKFLQLLHDYYPEFVAKQLWINVSWWYRNYCRVYSIVTDIWSTKEVIFSGQTKATATLFKCISPAQVPVKYGGLSRENDEKINQSCSNDIVSEVTIRPSVIHRVEFNFAKPCNVVWELKVTSWDVIYDAKFVPDMKDSYITNISRPRKLTKSSEPVISENYATSEPGTLILTLNNTSAMKKKLLIRVRVMSSDWQLEDEPSLRGWLGQSDEAG